MCPSVTIVILSRTSELDRGEHERSYRVHPHYGATYDDTFIILDESSIHKRPVYFQVSAGNAFGVELEMRVVCA